MYTTRSMGSSILVKLISSGVGTRGARGATGPPPPIFQKGGGLAPPIIRLDTKPLCMFSFNFQYIIPDFLRKSLV